MKLFLPLAGALFLLTAGAQAALPQPPCAGGAPLAYPAPGAAPAISIWHDSDLTEAHWQPPACTGWTGRSKLVVELAGSFRFGGSMADLVARVGSISTLAKVQYWSTTDKKWRPLANGAAALTSPDAKSRRGDFSASEMTKGADRYYWEDDSRTGAAVYRLRVYENTPERAILASENVTPVRQFFVTLFQTGAIQSVMFIQRLSPGVFGIYSLSRTGEGTSGLAAGHDASYVNRAAALYRQVAGIKTDQEPPAAP
ncbi:MAG TPA: DUF6675 family protein [Rhizomicrobium sp.]|nr:DUF6675 family protein [Rhizomicrobium sp.]